MTSDVQSQPEDQTDDTLDLKQKALDDFGKFYSELWNGVKDFLKENVELPNDDQFDVLTAWIVASYLQDQFGFFPYLQLYGPKKSGKTRLQTVLSLLCFNSISSVFPTPATLFRSIRGNNEYHTVFIDEFSFSNPNSEICQAILQILNAGYKKGGSIPRCSKDLENDSDFDIKEFPVDGFKCVAGTFDVLSTLKSRCLTIQMRKTRTRFPMRIDEEKAKTLQKHLQLFHDIVVQLDKKEFWTITDEIEKKLFGLSGFDGRLVELFSSLYAVAPEQEKQTIENYLKESGEFEIQEELASWEYEVFSAILEAPILSNWFSTKDVTVIINNKREEKEKVKSGSVGRQIRQFGFEAYHNHNINGYKWNNSLVQKLKERYPNIEEKQTQLETNGTPPLPEPTKDENQ